MLDRRSCVDLPGRCARQPVHFDQVRANSRRDCLRSFDHALSDPVLALRNGCGEIAAQLRADQARQCVRRGLSFALQRGYPRSIEPFVIARPFKCRDASLEIVIAN